MRAAPAEAEPVSVEDYLAGEAGSPVKHEYLGGVVYAMAGATNAHNEIASNVLGTLHGQLRGKPCRPYNSDAKVRIQFPTHTRFYYPDAMVVCQRGPGQETFQDWPVVIVEVLSDSTRRTDQQEKRDAYFTIPTLRVYLVLESERVAGTAWRRGPRGFVAEAYAGSEATILLPEIECALSLAEAYEAVVFPPPGVALSE